MDRTTLLASLGTLTAPAELVTKLQGLTGSEMDRLFRAIELLYAFHDRLDATGVTVLGELTAHCTAQGWQTDRMQAITAKTAAPMVNYRDDQLDWRTPPDLNQLKAVKRAAVNDLRDKKQDEPAPTPFGLVDNDERSKARITGAVTMAILAAQQAAPFAVDWTMHDNTVMPLDGPKMMQLGQAAGKRVVDVHDRARALKALIDGIVVTNGDLNGAVAALNAVDITIGWPA